MKKLIFFGIFLSILVLSSFLSKNPNVIKNHKKYQFIAETDSSTQRLEISYITSKKISFRLETKLKKDTCSQLIENFAKKTKEQKVSSNGLIKYDVFRYKNVKIAYNQQDPTVIFVYYLPIKLKEKDKTHIISPCNNIIFSGKLNIAHW